VKDSRNAGRRCKKHVYSPTSPRWKAGVS
jgi:hypothetical protein